MIGFLWKVRKNPVKIRFSTFRKSGTIHVTKMLFLTFRQKIRIVLTEKVLMFGAHKPSDPDLEPEQAVLRNHGTALQLNE